MAFTIRELEALSGIKAHTIRIWEQRYQFLKPSRTQTNIRTYSNDELRTLLTVSLLNRYGIKISRINDMDATQREQAVLSLPQPDARTEYLVNELVGHMIEMRNFDFEAVLNRHIAAHGLEHTITDLIFRFLEKVGLLWQTGRIFPVQEHIVSNIIRQKIVTAIDGLPFVAQESPLFLLFLPEDEHHEFGLLFIYYLLRRRGLPVIYLGPNVPLADVRYLLKSRRPDYLYLHLTTFPRSRSFVKFLQQLQETAPGLPVLISGAVAQVHRKVALPQLTLFQSFDEVRSYIAQV